MVFLLCRLLPVSLYLFNVLGDQPELLGPCRINLVFVTEGDRLERKEYFAGFVHRFDLLLESLRGGSHAKFAARINENSGPSRRGLTEDASYVTDAALTGNTKCTRANVDIVAASCLIETRFIAYAVLPLPPVLLTRAVHANGCVDPARVVAGESVNTSGRVAVAGGVAFERTGTLCRVGGATDVA